MARRSAIPPFTRCRSPDDVRAWIHATAALSQRYGSVCSGAFVLAETGLLDGRHANTREDRRSSAPRVQRWGSHCSFEGADLQTPWQARYAIVRGSFLAVGDP